MKKVETTAQEAVKETTGLKVEKNETITPKVPTLADKMASIEQLNQLNKGYKRLDETLKELDSFKMAENPGFGSSNTLTIQDNERHEFKTTNPVLIGDIIEFVKEKLESRMKEFETKICAININ